jgi:glycosyltransferase involved in cell wall biosynthesis
MPSVAGNIVFLVHYFPPINSTGGKRVEALSKYFARWGRTVSVVTTVKSGADGAFSESAPDGVTVLEMDRLGRLCCSVPPVARRAGPKSATPRWTDRLKAGVQRWFGQLPDPRLPFATAFASPLLAPEIAETLNRADVVVSSMPPWPMHLAALVVRWRFGRRVVMDYRDNFSANHIMPGSAAAKYLEVRLDRWLARHADGVVVISEPMAEYYREFSDRVKVVLNGYDGEIIDSVRNDLDPAPNADRSPVTVRYLGRISRNRIPRALISAVSEAIREGRLSMDGMRFQLYGECEQLRDYVVQQHPHIMELFEFHPLVSYRKALGLMLTADYLLFAETSDQSSLSARGVLTTKLFEYLACGRPILAEIDENTEAGRLIRRAGRGHVVAKSREDFVAFLEGALAKSPVADNDAPFVQTLSRQSQAVDYLAFLDNEICGRGAR